LLRFGLNLGGSGQHKPYIFKPEDLFFLGEQGAYYAPGDISTLFQDAAGTTPVTADGDPVGSMADQSPNEQTAVQSTSAARPTYKTNPDRLSLDKVDDALIITVPTGGWNGTMVLATDEGTVSYGVDIPAGDYNLGGEPFPGNAIVGALFRDGALSAGEKADAEAYFVGNGATASYGTVVDFNNFWRSHSEITEFPLIDTSSGTSFYAAWYICSSLTSFPANAFDNIKGGYFSAAFLNTALDQTSIDGILVSLVTSGITAGTFDQSGGSAPSVDTGQPAIDTLRSRGWTVSVEGGY
jgi:hypothetical protein